MPSSYWLCSNIISAHIYTRFKEVVPCTWNKAAATHKVHPYGGGRCCLNFCADVFNEGIFVLVVDNDLGSRRCHQEGVVVCFIYIENDLQSWRRDRAGAVTQAARAVLLLREGSTVSLTLPGLK